MVNDLEAIRAKWLPLCGACDAGLPILCVCCHEDYRPVMLALIQELEECRSDDR